MDPETLRRLAPRVGISAASVIRKAEEFLRMSQVKCAGLGAHTTATSNAVMCLHLAASTAKHPVDKDYLVKLSGLPKKSYESYLKSFECLLGVDSHLGIRELAVQYGCLEAVNTASKILQRYESSLPEAQQNDLDLSKPLFTTAALFAACRCRKMKVEKTKLVTASGVKKTIFDRLCIQLEKIGQQLYQEELLSAQQPTKRTKTLLERIETEEEDEEGLCKQPKMKNETEGKPDYEEWKRKILEKAAQAPTTGV
ncbi:origin recognition complex subunit 6 [Ambystoma mexicanum]|uniref:origin recognition complex subunit 6 n=1 Tax=Ambystoma mexicanum TaxID=8296 RepID=UPI0037E89029